MTHFNITTSESKGNWLFVASDECTRLGLDTLDVDTFIINGITFRFEFNHKLQITGLTKLF